MQWTFTCVLLASCAVISASDHGVRSKRDLSFIKRYFMSKILGHHAANTTKIVNPSENYRLFRIPGHDKILVKAVPKIPVVFDTEAAYPAVSEVIETESVPVHPSIAIVSKYLGTSQLNDTLFALKGVKNLLQSGVLTAQREGIDQISTFKEELLQPVLVEPSNIAVGYNKRPVMVYPTLGETLIGKITPGHRYPNIKVPTHYSYKQVNKGGVTSYTAHDSQNVLVTEIKRPVPLPAPVNHRIWEILSLGSYRLPTSPVVRPVIGMEKVELPPVNMVPGYHSNHLYHEGSGTMHSAQMVLQVEDDTPVVIEKVTKPVVSKVEGVYKVHGSTHKVKLPSHSSGYSYNQVHNDGSMTMYSGSGKVVEHEGEKSAIVMTDPGRPTLVVSGVEEPPAPIPVYNLPKIKAPSSAGYSYNHVHNDGSKTTYFGSGHVVENKVERPAVVITEPGRPTVFVPDVDRPAFIPVYNRHTVKGSTGSGFSYNQVHNDGSVTTYSGSGNVVEHMEEKPAMVITEPGRPTIVVADMERPPASIPVYNLPKVETPSSSGYSYSHVHNDESMTTYAGSGHVVEHVGKNPAMVITEPGRPTVVVADMKRPPAPIPVYNVPKVKIPSGSGYSYNHVHNDGFVTTYLGSGHVKHVGEKPAMVITEPGRPTVVMADVEGPPAPIPVYNLPKVKVPSNSGYAYSHVHNDGLITTYAGSGHTVEHLGVQPPVVITEPGRPTVVVPDVKGPPAPIPTYNLPKVEAPSSSGYSYSHVHNDGSMTTYAGSGHVVEHEGEMPPVVITEPGRPTVVVADVERPPVMVPVYNSPKVKAPSGSGYSYSHVHNDGSMTTYNGSGHVVEHEGERPPVVITEPGRPTVVVADVKGPPAPIPAYNLPKVEAPSSSGYSYSHVHNDGSMTTYAGSGHVVEHERERQPVVITEPGRPTVVVDDVERPPVMVPVYNSPRVRAPSGSGFSYDHVHNDGSVTMYSGSGQVVEHEEKKSGVVISAYGKPTEVMAGAEGLPAPIPDYNLPNAPSGSGYTYNHVHNDGFMTTYSGSGRVDHVGEKPAMVITEPGRPTVVVADVEGPPATIPAYNLPKVKAPSGSGFFYNHVHNDGSVTTYSGSGNVVEHEGERPPVVITEPGRPTVVVADVEGPPAPMPVYNLPKAPSGSGYFYDHVRNDGLITTYTGSGKVNVNEHRGERPAAVITESGRPTVVVSGVDGHAAPIPVYNAPKAQTGYSYSHMNNDAFMKNNYDQVNTLIVEERPEHMYKYEHVRNSYEMPQRPHIREQVKVNVNSQNENSRPSPSSHTGFSYKTVHEDGSVTDYSDVKVTDGAKLDRPMLYPTGPAETHQHDKGHSAVAEKCKNRTRGGVSKNCKSHSVAVSSNSSHYSYKTVSQDGSTSYSGSGHVQVESAKFDTAAYDKEVSSSIVNAPLLVTQTDDDSPQKVTFTPNLSKYSYKQVNNHKPDDFQDEKVNKVVSAINRTSESQSIDVSEAPKDVYVTPPEVNEPVPIKKPVDETINTTKKTVAVPYTTRKSVAVSTSTKSSHFKPKRVYRKRVRTSTSRSSLRTSVPETTTSQESSSTAVTTEGSLSANPIVVLPEEEKVFSFKQERSDGSSITVVGDNDNKVSAVLEESKTSLNRGDIPESSF